MPFQSNCAAIQFEIFDGFLYDARLDEAQKIDEFLIALFCCLWCKFWNLRDNIDGLRYEDNSIKRQKKQKQICCSILLKKLLFFGKSVFETIKGITTQKKQTNSEKQIINWNKIMFDTKLDKT